MEGEKEERWVSLRGSGSVLVLALEMGNSGLGGGKRRPFQAPNVDCFTFAACRSLRLCPPAGLAANRRCCIILARTLSRSFTE